MQWRWTFLPLLKGINDDKFISLLLCCLLLEKYWKVSEPQRNILELHPKD